MAEASLIQQHRHTEDAEYAHCPHCGVLVDLRFDDEISFHEKTPHSWADVMPRISGRLPLEAKPDAALFPLPQLREGQTVFLDYHYCDEDEKIAGWGTLHRLDRDRWQVRFKSGGSFSLGPVGIKRWCKGPINGSERRAA